MAKIQLNGKKITINSRLSVLELLKKYKLKPVKIKFKQTYLFKFLFDQ